MRYKLRHVLALVLLWAVPAFTCGQISLEPLVRDLILRVGALEAQQAVILDANGVQVGTVTDISGSNYLMVVVEVQEWPVLLYVTDEGIDPEPLWFSSADCSGTALVPTNDGTGGLLGSYAYFPASRTGYVSGTPVSTSTIRSRLRESDETCQPVTPFNIATAPAVRAPEIEGFTPPFEFVTRASLLP